MKLTTVNIPEGLVKALDKLVQKGLYPDRSYAIRYDLRLLIEEHEKLHHI